MAGATLKIEIDGDHKVVSDYLAQLSQKLAGSLKPVFADIGEHLLISHAARWATEQAPDGTPWAALSPAYLNRKPKNKDKKLVLEGYLRDLLRYQASDSELLFGTDRPYGATHQFGARRGAFGTQTVAVKAHQRRGRPIKSHSRQVTIPWGDIPARPWLGLSADDETEIFAILEKYLAAIP